MGLVLQATKISLMHIQSLCSGACPVIALILFVRQQYECGNETCITSTRVTQATHTPPGLILKVDATNFSILVILRTPVTHTPPGLILKVDATNFSFLVILRTYSPACISLARFMQLNDISALIPLEGFWALRRTFLDADIRIILLIQNLLLSRRSRSPTSIANRNVVTFFGLWIHLGPAERQTWRPWTISHRNRGTAHWSAGNALWSRCGALRLCAQRYASLSDGVLELLVC